MNLAALLAETRLRLDDEAQPYRHADGVLTGWLNEAQREAAERARLIVDSATPEITRIALRDGVAAYPLDPRILFVQRARLDANELAPAAVGDLLRSGCADWSGEPRRYGLDMDAGTLTLLPAPDRATEDAVIVTAAVWLAGTLSVTTEAAIGASVGDLVTLAGYADGTHVVTTVAGSAFGLAVADDPGAFVAATAARHRNLSLTVLRAPLADMEADDDEPEIPARYHRDLIDWCCHLAYLLRDSDTESFQRATAFEQRFTQRFGPRLSARDHARLSRNPSTQLRPPPGGL